ncbi:MAG: aminomethyltransferase family protein, partial [Actinomycetota bacterium]
KYKVSGTGSAAWLQGLFTNSLPKIGRTVLTAMLNKEGKIVGEFSISRVGEEEFFLFGSQAAEVHHPRWFLAHLPANSQIRFETLSLSMVGLTVAGPRSRDVLQKLTSTSLATKDFPFMSFRRVNIGNAPVWLSRMTYTGDLGYEIWIAPEYQRYLFDLIWGAGKEFDMRLFGFRALITMRLEKNFGTWFREYRPIYTPLEAGMDRVLKFDHEFIGRAAVEAEMKTGPSRKLLMFTVEVDKDKPADVIGDEPVFHGGKVVGWITSGGYAHYSGVSLALGYIPAELAKPGTTGFEIEIIGKMQPASLQIEPVLDPSGSRMRV